MMPLRLPLLACFALAACDSGPPDASDYARRAQRMVGQSFGPVTLSTIEAEGNVLVVTFDGKANWRGGNPSFIITAQFLDGFCEAKESSGFFAEGRTMRVDTLEDGRAPIKGSPVTRCRDV